MPAFKRGMENGKILARFLRALCQIPENAAGTARKAIERLLIRRERQRLGLELRQINDHALRDIGLVRDPFSGIILSNGGGEVIEIEAKRPVRSVQRLRLHIVGADDRTASSRGHERRVAERRTAERRHESAAAAMDRHADRREFDRRSIQSGIVDCRTLFLRRNNCILV